MLFPEAEEVSAGKTETEMSDTWGGVSCTSDGLT